MTAQLATTPARDDREIGPIGTAARVAGGLLLLAWPALLDEIGPWDVAGGVVALPLLAVAIATGVDAAFQRLSPDPAEAKRTAWSARGVLVVGLVLGCATALTFVTPADAPAVWVFLGVSMLVAAQRGHGGCEVLVLSNLVSGRDDRVACVLFAPVDAAQSRHRLRRPAPDRVPR